MSTRPGISKYFMAIVPPSPIFEQAWQWKEYCKTAYNTQAALNSPPHITLHMPFEWKTEKESKLVEPLDAYSKTQTAFTLGLEGFGCFPPRVIYIKVVENPALMQLQASLTRFCKSELNLFNANRLDQPYHPHLTVAFRDLKKAIFPIAWDHVKNQKFQCSFTCSEFVLLKHNGRAWLPHRSFSLLKT